MKLIDILIYPIKSGSGISISSSWVEQQGLAFDRRFVVSDEQGSFITARTEPILCLIKASIIQDGLILTAPEMPILKISYTQLLSRYQKVDVWSDTIMGQRCHNDVDQWISQYLNKPCHLLYFGHKSSRYLKQSNVPLTFADGYPLLLISQSSLNDLNQRLENPVSMAHFRPNIVIDDCLPYEEDGWKRIKIGEVEFEVSTPCTRCIFTTIDPQTGRKDNQREPLSTLKGYRKIPSGDVIFGQNIIPLNTGQINLNDQITIINTQSKPKVNGISTQYIKPSTIELKCAGIINETHDVKTFILKPNDGKLIKYHAGQHLPLTVNINGVQTKAIYTLSSSPTRPESLSITVKRIDKGKVSNYLHDHFHVGDQIRAQQPNGRFHYQGVNTEKLLLISAGSGITPMLSMLRAMVDLSLKNDIVFMHTAKSDQDIIAYEEVATLAKKHGNCKLYYTLTQNAPTGWQGYQGRMSVNMFSEISNISEYQVMICGPEKFRGGVKSSLISLGLPESHYHYESFGVRRTTKEKDSIGQVPSKKLTILFDSWNKRVQGNSSETILEQGESAGLIIPYSCRAGMCGCCKVKLESGQVNELASDFLTTSEKDQGYILACSCIPLTDVVISSV